jgi:hypothetical protein
VSRLTERPLLQLFRPSPVTCAEIAPHPHPTTSAYTVARAPLSCRANAPFIRRAAPHPALNARCAMDGFDTITMSWARPQLPMQTVTGPEGHMTMPMAPMDPYDRRSAFDVETFAG